MVFALILAFDPNNSVVADDSKLKMDFHCLDRGVRRPVGPVSTRMPFLTGALVLKNSCSIKSVGQEQILLLFRVARFDH